MGSSQALVTFIIDRTRLRLWALCAHPGKHVGYGTFGPFTYFLILGLNQNNSKIWGTIVNHKLNMVV